MPFDYFTLDNLELDLGVKTRQDRVFAEVPPVTPPEWLMATLERNHGVTAGTGEKSRSESVIYPVLVAAAQSVPEPVRIYSGQRLMVHETRGLHGQCDFLLTRTASLPQPTAPILTVIEAVETMRWDVSASVGRCIAQMAAVAEFNDAAGNRFPHVFGCRTDGVEWQFLRLAEGTTTLDYERFRTSDLPRLLGALRLTLLTGL